MRAALVRSNAVSRHCIQCSSLDYHQKWPRTGVDVKALDTDKAIRIHGPQELRPAKEVPQTLSVDSPPSHPAQPLHWCPAASGTILISFNWPKNTDRYRRIDNFVKALFPRLAEFRKPPRHERSRL